MIGGCRLGWKEEEEKRDLVSQDGPRTIRNRPDERVHDLPSRILYQLCHCGSEARLIPSVYLASGERACLPMAATPSAQDL